MIVCSDHSQAPVEERIRLDRGVRRLRGRDAAAPRGRSGAEVALSPAQRSAMIYALDPDRRERDRRAARWRRSPTSRASTWRCGCERRRGRRSAAAAASCGSRRAASSRTCAAARWSVEGDLGGAARRGPGRAAAVHRVPRRAGAGLVGAAVPHRRRRPAVGRAGLRVRRLGRRRPRRRRLATARCTAPTRSARCCGAGPARPVARAREQWSLRDIAPMVRDHFGLATTAARSRLARPLDRLRGYSRSMTGTTDTLTRDAR